MCENSLLSRMQCLNTLCKWCFRKASDWASCKVYFGQIFMLRFVPYLKVCSPNNYFLHFLLSSEIVKVLYVQLAIS